MASPQEAEDVDISGQRDGSSCADATCRPSGIVRAAVRTRGATLSSWHDFRLVGGESDCLLADGGWCSGGLGLERFPAFELFQQLFFELLEFLGGRGDFFARLLVERGVGH